MIGSRAGAIIVAYCEPVDMRKGFEGLSGLVREQLNSDPLDGALYLFTNRRRTRAKILCFDGSGLCVYAKRLERGRFAALWKYSERKKLPLKKSELELFLEGSHLIARFQVSPPILSNADLAISDRT